MDDLSSAISGFLAQPGAMEQLEAMAKQLGLSLPQQQEQEGPAPTAQNPAPDAVEAGNFSPDSLDLGTLGGGLGGLLPDGLTPEKLGRLMQAVQEGNQPDRTTAFLEALRPLLGGGKQDKLERALRAVRLTRTAKAVTKSIEL